MTATEAAMLTYGEQLELIAKREGAECARIVDETRRAYGVKLARAAEIAATTDEYRAALLAHHSELRARAEARRAEQAEAQKRSALVDRVHSLRTREFLAERELEAATSARKRSQAMRAIGGTSKIEQNETNKRAHLAAVQADLTAARAALEAYDASATEPTT